MKKWLLIFNIFLVLTTTAKARAMENTTQDISHIGLSPREVRFHILKILIADRIIIQEDFFKSASAIKQHLKNCFKNLFLACKLFHSTIVLDHEKLHKYATAFYQQLLLKKFLNQEKHVSGTGKKELVYYVFKNSPFLNPGYMEYPEKYETIINLVERFLTTIHNPFNSSQLHLLIEDIIEEGLELSEYTRVNGLWWIDLCNVLQLFYEQIFLWSKDDQTLLHRLIFSCNELFWQNGEVNQTEMKVCWHILQETSKTYLKTRKKFPSLTELKSPKQLLEMICPEENNMRPYWYYLIHWEQKNNRRKLLEYSVDLNQKDVSGDSVFHDLISSLLMNNFEKSPLEWLAENGANINALDAIGRTPMDCVITEYWYNNNNMKALLKYKANFKPNLYSELILKGEESEDVELKTLIREHPTVKDNIDQLVNNCIARLRYIDRNHKVK